ncbi:MAG: PcfJ-like protein [Bacteroidia bacterium]|nr:PcfJ-like protein [Bacteroidia bacterium]
MKPKTKFQKQVAEQSKRLAPITRKQRDWAFQNCLEHQARRLKNGKLTCLECGHSWAGGHTLAESICSCTCPHCQAELKVIDTRKQSFKQAEYYGIYTVCGSFQVLRYFFLEKHCRVGSPARLHCREVVQHWIAPNGKCAIMARSRSMNVLYYDVWNWSSALEIRQERQAHLVSPVAVYPHKRFIPEVKRNGFRGNFYGLLPRNFFRNILTDSRMETLLKSGQIGLFRYFSVERSKDIADFWASIRICIRNKYAVSDASLWCDYVNLLRFFGKDLSNAKFVCPTDLKAEHDRWMLKKQTWNKHQKREERRKQLLQNEQAYSDLKANFIGLEFSEGKLHIRVLKDVNEFYEEGNTLKHCVFTNEYFLKPDTLVFSAQIDGQRIETVEVSLESFQVIQSRGLFNQNTEFHDQIVSIVNRNVHLIRERMTA